MIKKLFSFLGVLICLWGCKAEKITIPAYVQIDDYYTKVALGGPLGTNNQKFTDMLVFANGQSCGTYPVGKPVPVLTSGPTTILIRGVVEINGVGAVRADYELMAGCDTILNVTPGQVTKIRPVFEYFSGVNPRWLDNFDGDSGCIGGNNNLTQDSGSFLSQAGQGFGGTGYCLLLAPTAKFTTAMVQRSSLYLPPGGVGVYMEFNYLSNVNITVNIIGVASGNSYSVGGVYPSPVWNKIYLDLTEEVSNLNDATGYYINILSNYDPTVGANFAYIDNIKILSKQ